MFGEKDIRLAAEVMDVALDNTRKDYAAGDVAGEEDFSGQFVGRLKSEIEHLETPGVRWGTLTDSDVEVKVSGRQLKKRAEEPHFGADIALALSVRTENISIDKGLLIQAKILGPGGELSGSQYSGLKSQCSDMLEITSSSFVFGYSQEGVRVYSAAAVVANQSLGGTLTYSSRWFFQDFLICWIGDPKLGATDPISLKALKERAQAQHTLLLRASDRVWRSR